MNISRQIGWGTESNLLYQILKQITRLTSIMFSLKPKYKVFTALLTQSGGDDPQSGNGFTLTIGVTYEIGNNSGGADFTIVGAPNNEIGTKFIATGTTPNWGNDVADLSYNTGAPVAIVLENTIGNVWFTYTSPGVYYLNSDNLFIDGKTFINDASLVALPVFNRMIGEAGEMNVQKGYFFFKSSEATIQLKTLEDVETLADNVISNPICIEIRVYN